VHTPRHEGRAVTLLEALLVTVAGLGAGAINAVIGSGTLITFPVLLALGYPPVLANVSNTVGLVPGSASAVYGYRRELRAQRARAWRLAPLTALGAAGGAALLLVLPDDAFRVIVPVLIAAALVLIVFQPRISRLVEERRRDRGVGRENDDRREGNVVRGGVLATGVYGGYFGAAQGILLFALLANAVPEDLQQASALRNLLAGVANGVAALVFIAVADVAVDVAVLIAAGAIAGGLVGARIGRRLPPAALRAVVVVVGLAAIAQLVL
jgi:uncharacterized membrane protein YfcA